VNQSPDYWWYLAANPFWFAVTIGGFWILFAILNWSGVFEEHVPTGARDHYETLVTNTLVVPLERAIKLWWGIMPVSFVVSFIAWGIVALVVRPLMPYVSVLGMWTWIGVAPLLAFGVGAMRGIRFRMLDASTRYCVIWCLLSAFFLIASNLGWLNAANFARFVGLMMALAVLCFVVWFFRGFIAPIVGSLFGGKAAKAQYDARMRLSAEAAAVDPDGKADLHGQIVDATPIKEQ
jgi:ABC-type multidrug transport system fused ATPase/permease subunit